MKKRRMATPAFIMGGVDLNTGIVHLPRQLKRARPGHPGVKTRMACKGKLKLTARETLKAAGRSFGQ